MTAAGHRNPLVHLELHTADAGRACELYERLLGWRAETVEAGGAAYRALELGGGVEGSSSSAARGAPSGSPTSR